MLWELLQYRKGNQLYVHTIPSSLDPFPFRSAQSPEWSGPCHAVGSHWLSALYAVVYIYGIPLQNSCLENSMDGGAWWAAVHGVAKSRTRLSNFTFTFHFYALEKEMATHSSVLAWRIPGTGEPGGLLSMGSHWVGHNWSDLAAIAALKLGEWHTRTLFCWF